MRYISRDSNPHRDQNLTVLVTSFATVSAMPSAKVQHIIGFSNASFAMDTGAKGFHDPAAQRR
ncbi:MAG: hypothetical protein J0G33_04115 [Afipia felis]|nr:hypothetical protein [Afipia felis]